MTTTSERAYRAGFALSTEGFNGAYGAPSDEWMHAYYRRDMHGEPLPNTCRQPRDPEQPSSMHNPLCGRPAGHPPPHRVEHGPYSGPREWTT